MDFKEKTTPVKTSIPTGCYPPVVLPGVVQQEIIDDENGLLLTKKYINNLNFGMEKETITLEHLKERYGEKMINEMVGCIKKFNPLATEKEIVLSISFHL